MSCRIRRGQKIFAFIRRCIRTGFCSPDLADFHDLYLSSDEKLFNKILTCPNYILQTLLPPPTAQNYSLRNRPHNRQLPDRISRITDCNFTVRMLYRNMYWLLYILDLRFVLFLCTTAVWQFAINEYVMLCYGVRLSAIKRRLKSDVFRRRLKAISDGDVMTSDGRAFQTRGAAETAKARSPTVIRRVGETGRT